MITVFRINFAFVDRLPCTDVPRKIMTDARALNGCRHIRVNKTHFEEKVTSIFQTVLGSRAYLYTEKQFLWSVLRKGFQREPSKSVIFSSGIGQNLVYLWKASAEFIDQSWLHQIIPTYVGINRALGHCPNGKIGMYLWGFFGLVSKESRCWGIKWVHWMRQWSIGLKLLEFIMESMNKISEQTTQQTKKLILYKMYN